MKSVSVCDFDSQVETSQPCILGYFNLEDFILTITYQTAKASNLVHYQNSGLYDKLCTIKNIKYIHKTIVVNMYVVKTCVYICMCMYSRPNPLVDIGCLDYSSK